MNSSILWDIMPYSPLEVNRRYMLHFGYLLGIFFDPEDGGDIFL
jgi:hypothetical protein